MSTTFKCDKCGVIIALPENGVTSLLCVCGHRTESVVSLETVVRPGNEIHYTPGPVLPKNAEERKTYPLARGLLDYFPDALLAVSHVSWKGNQQHHPDKPLHWDKSKSTDEADALLRHLLRRGMKDIDGIRESAKVAWRALALLQREIDSEKL